MQDTQTYLIRAKSQAVSVQSSLTRRTRPAQKVSALPQSKLPHILSVDVGKHTRKIHLRPMGGSNDRMRAIIVPCLSAVTRKVCSSFVPWKAHNRALFRIFNLVQKVRQHATRQKHRLQAAETRTRRTPRRDRSACED